MKITVISQTFDGVFDVDVLIGINGCAAHHLFKVELGCPGLPAIDMDSLTGFKFHHGAEFFNSLFLGSDDMIAAAGMLGVDIGTT